MHLKQAAFAVIAVMIFGVGCSKKEHPQSASAAGKTTENKTVVRKVEKMPVPKVITVDDRAAKRTPDGRLYYDFDGRRYWRNYNDGKYYLYNKKMYNDPAFKPH